MNNSYVQDFFSLMGSGHPALIIQLAILNIAALVAWVGWRAYYNRIMQRFTQRALQALLIAANLVLVINVSGDLDGLAGAAGVLF